MMTEFPPKSEFRKWLRSLPLGEVVAKSWGCSSCPLATWLCRGSAVAAYVRPGKTAAQSAWRFIAGEAQPLPEWANAFGNSIDKLGLKRWAAVTGYGPVTAAECLAVLRRTPRE